MAHGHDGGKATSGHSRSWIYDKKKAAGAAVAVIIVLGILAQAAMYFGEVMKEDDLTIASIGWSQYCDGRQYTDKDVAEFCANCSAIPSNSLKAGCKFPVDMRFSIPHADAIRAGGAEIHCHMVVDGADEYLENGRYYGITEKELFTWELLDANRGHAISFCCGQQRDSLMSMVFGLRSPMDQVCVSANVEARCIER